ncbi:MAG: lipid-transfer protein [Chloroflexi bacterium]|nr:lipid-transfer protein [Chloroflexota bacterium]
MNGIKDKCAIVGIGETEYSRDSGRSELSLALEAIRGAVDDAGLSLKDIDGLFKFTVDSNSEEDVVSGLGISWIRAFGQVNQFGGAACGLVAHAAWAIVTGMANYVVCFRALNGRSGRRYGSGALHARGGEGNNAFSEPFGLLVPGQRAAMQARRHMHEYGTTSRQLGAIAVAIRKHACLNPRALMYGRPMTLEDHQNSRLVHDPLRLFDMCLETDGGCALVITSAERAKNLRHKPVYVMAAVQALAGNAAVDYASSSARLLAPQIFVRAGVTPQEVDVVGLVDPFTISVLVKLEDYGFCGKGEGGPFVEGGRIEVGGELPVNTSGGELSEGYLHGMNLFNEAVRQLRGTASAQVTNAEVALVDSGPGFGAVILRR